MKLVRIEVFDWKVQGMESLYVLKCSLLLQKGLDDDIYHVTVREIGVGLTTNLGRFCLDGCFEICLDAFSYIKCDNNLSSCANTAELSFDLIF